MPIALDGIRTCISGIHAHSASDCTTTAGTPPVSRNKHFRHSPVSSIVKQSCMKHSNSYLRDRDAKHLQGPPLSRTRRVRERRKIESARARVCVCVCVCVRVHNSQLWWHQGLPACHDYLQFHQDLPKLSPRSKLGTEVNNLSVCFECVIFCHSCDYSS